PGCGMMGLIGGLMLLIALIIVALSGAAGWTAGQREANVNATATQNASVNEQLQHIPQDIASGNIVLLNVRLNYMLTVAPNAPGLAELMQTATALYIARQPTITPTPSPTIETTVEPEATLEIASTPASDSPFDPATMLQQAQTAVNTAQWADAIELLEAISVINPNYEAVTVRQLLTDAMNNYARQLYQNGQPALANTVVGRIESFGLPLAEGLAYERDVAELFLNAQAASAASDPRAINNLQQIINQGPAGRYYTQARDLLYDFYVRQGDYLAGDPNNGYCPAAQQYQFAVNIYPSGAATGKLRTANDMCAQATPTPDPLLAGTPGQTIAPIGV
ncbi:MAG: hypothetical protein L0Z53_17925, partial [Acidobacteriales bacterium]|nr:hypothetical protein [Terriglobales bacterium]